MKLIIDPELHAYIPPASEENDAQLKASIEALGGPVSPLVVWAGQNVLIEGHRRYKACQELGIAITADMCKFLSFPDKDAVRKYMDSTYASTRRLSDLQDAVVTARALGQVERGEKTEARQKIAEARGVSPKTVQRDERLGIALDTLPNSFRDRVKTGELTATRSEILDLASLPPDEQEKLIASVDKGEFSSIGKALKGEEAEEKASVEELVKEAHKRLGRAMEGICRVNEASVNRRKLAECRKLVDEVSALLDGWK